MSRFWIVVLVATLGWSASIRADGNKLLANCSEAERFMGDNNAQVNQFNVGVCFGALIGARSAALSFSETAKPQDRICVPPIPNSQAILVVNKYLRAHPERLHEEEGLLVVRALKEAFPCK